MLGCTEARDEGAHCSLSSWQSTHKEASGASFISYLLPTCSLISTPLLDCVLTSVHRPLWVLQTLAAGTQSHHSLSCPIYHTCALQELTQLYWLEGFPSFLSSPGGNCLPKSGCCVVHPLWCNTQTLPSVPFWYRCPCSLCLPCRRDETLDSSLSLHLPCSILIILRACAPSPLGWHVCGDHSTQPLTDFSPIPHQHSLFLSL